MMLTNIIFLNSLLNKKVSNNPNKNRMYGILFPESMIPTPKIHIIIVLNINLKLFLFFNIDVTKKIEKKEKFCIKPPAINSSPKKPELW